MSGARDPNTLSSAIQRRAADPRRTVVLRASAGSGKTKVLVDRILRLLIDGAPLKSVAALTFTRKAAIEIQERLLKAIRELTLAGDQERRKLLADLLGEPPTDEIADRAARLFPQVLEDANGQLVGTIHTFCQVLLSRFADLAGLDPGFAILEKTDLLWEEAFRKLETEIAADPGAVTEMSRLSKSPTGTSQRLEGLMKSRLELDRWSDHLAALKGDAFRSGPLSDLYPALRANLAAELFADTPLEGVGDPQISSLLPVVAEAFRNLAAIDLDPILQATEKPTPSFIAKLDERRETFRTQAESLAGEGDPGERLAAAFGAILTGNGTLRKLGAGSKASKALWDDMMTDAAAPILESIRLRDLIDLYDANVRILRFGLRALDIYADLKARDRCLDFHDLERMAWELLRSRDVGPWIRYRLDQRIDHLLIDEFQDTNRNQWEILETFAEEFLSAEAETPRTVFFVGDVKQSIYGFRGAEPRIFDEVARDLSDRFGVESLTLPTNFRSCAAVVESVGKAFGSPELSTLLPSPGEVEAVRQLHVRETPPGCVCIRPLEGTDPEDESDGHEAAAKRLVDLVREIVETCVIQPRDAAPRRARYGDILVLSRARTRIGLYEAALREAGIPFVPSGRGALAKSREVGDILTLLRWLAYPADSVSLIASLRSPLFRMDDATMRDLLAGWRKGRPSFWQYLKSRSDQAGTVDRLKRWVGSAKEHGAHDMLRLIYDTSGALVSYRAAMGEQAQYNLLKLHDMALEHDASRFPTLRAFIDRIRQAEIHEDEEEASLPESGHGRVRILTIHGAKGLQAPYVILADADYRPMDKTERLVLEQRPAKPLVCGLRKAHREAGDAPRPTAVARAAQTARERELREEANLLYVAMTRAEDEFHVLGSQTSKTDETPSHYRWLSRALPDAATDCRRETAAAAADDVTRRAQISYETWEPRLPRELIRMRYPSAETADETRNPALDDQIEADRGRGELADEIRRTARDRGVRIHRLLEIAADTGEMPPGEDEARAEAAAVFGNPDFAWIFTPDCEALCEAPLMHDPADRPGDRVAGIIDRLLIADDTVTIIDYKSNRIAAEDVAAEAETYRGQMQAYRAALEAIYPERKIRAVLLFTQPERDGRRGMLFEV